MIIITGVSSFVGFHLALGLKAKGFEVLGVITKPIAQYSGIRLQRLEKIREHCPLQTLDITDATATRQFIAEQKPKIWIHHAGFATKYASLDYDIQKGHAVNVEPLPFIFDELKRNNAKGVIVTGSSMEYGVSSTLCKESDSCIPNTPYGLSKLTETLMALQLSARMDLPTRIARLYIPFGPLDAEEKLIPQIIGHLKAGSPMSLVPPEVMRDFLNVDDLVSAYALLVEDLSRGGAEIYNVCSGQPTALKELAEFIADQLKRPRDLLRFGVYPLRSGEGLVSCGDNQKLQNLGWKPKSLAQGIKDYLKTDEKTV